MKESERPGLRDAAGLAARLAVAGWQLLWWVPAWMAGCAYQCVVTGWRNGRGSAAPDEAPAVPAAKNRWGDE